MKKGRRMATFLGWLTNFANQNIGCAICTSVISGCG